MKAEQFVKEKGRVVHIHFEPNDDMYIRQDDVYRLMEEYCTEKSMLSVAFFSEWIKDNYNIDVPDRVVEEYRRYQALHIDHVMPRFVLMGFEFNDLWKVPDLFSHENDGILMTVDEWNKAQVFEAIELAEYKRQYLQANYNGYTWYIVRLN